ncbi:Major Facilitator Superfamily protein [Ekhidna lutea]|uniref:Major Facilitator Superfamily protein n=1 Tax=Ekhidna lutea TaxID=447679 RepID=A0A239HYD0_EKHLU|nr:MFS transporter [Ekhidna lutea]SNS85234.1 Major Facilitator Superfamily protein [Ekhidna lutea]
MAKSKEDISEQVYEYLVESGEERACDSITEESCKEAPGNFLLNGLNGFATKLAEQIASPELIIPYVFSLLGVPSFYSGLLVPIKNTGSLLPQLIVSAKIRAYPIRKYFWAIAGLAQGTMMILIGLTVYYLKGGTAGIGVVALILLFSMSSGVGSIAFKDVLGKTIPKGKRARLLSFRATGGGLLTIIAGLILFYFLSNESSVKAFSVLFLIAGMLWVLAASLFSFIKEEPGATEGGRSPIDKIKKGFSLLKSDNNFYNFLITRSLLLSIPLVQPFFVLYATDSLDVQLSGLGLFVIATGISNTISSPFWGKFSDRSSKKVMIVSAAFAAIICLYVLLFNSFSESFKSIYTFGPVFFFIIIAYGGARMSRKTYLVDYAPSKERPLYVSVANTFMGFITLIAGALSIIAGFLGVKVMIAFLMLLMILAGLSAIKLEEV